MAHSEKQELRPCPFCGGPVTIEDRGDNLLAFLCEPTSPCIGSGFGQYAMAEKRDSAIATWNRRVPRSTSSAVTLSQFDIEVLRMLNCEREVMHGEDVIATLERFSVLGYCTRRPYSMLPKGRAVLQAATTMAGAA